MPVHYWWSVALGDDMIGAGWGVSTKDAYAKAAIAVASTPPAVFGDADTCDFRVVIHKRTFVTDSEG